MWQPKHPHSNQLGRRNLLKATGAATALGLCGESFLAGSARADSLTKAHRDKLTACF